MKALYFSHVVIIILNYSFKIYLSVDLNEHLKLAARKEIMKKLAMVLPL